jgi:ribose transport system permease protein
MPDQAQAILTPGLPRDDERSAAAADERSAVRAQLWRRVLIQLFGIGSFYIVVVAVFSAQISNFLSGGNIKVILAGATVLGIVSIGQAFAIISGGFDLAVAGVLPMGAVLFGQLLEKMAFVPALVLVVLIGAGVGLLNGLVIAWLKINPLIATLALFSVTSGLAYIICDGETVPLLGASAGFWGDAGLLGLQNGTIAFIVLAIIATLVLRYTVYGRSIYTIGGNLEAAELAGLRTQALSVSVYMLSGALAIFAGAVSASQLLAASPSVGSDVMLNSVTAVILGGAALTGGTGGIPGTILGVLLLGTTTVGLNLLQVASFYQTLVTGGVLLLAVIFARVREYLLGGVHS